MEGSDIATYNIEPSKIFKVAVVNDQYKHESELLSGTSVISSIIVNLQTSVRVVTATHGTNGAAEDLVIEDPMGTKKFHQEIDRRNWEAETMKKQTAADEKAAAEKAAARAAADRESSSQSQSIPSGNAIAATGWSAWHMRIYFQDGRGQVRESRHDDGVWSGGDVKSTIFTAKLGTPLSVISWDNGRQVRWPLKSLNQVAYGDS